MVIRGYRVGPLLKATLHGIGEDNVGSLAAAAAFNFFFSLFPLLLFVAPLLTLVGDKRRMIEWLFAQITATLPGRQAEPIERSLYRVVLAPSAPGLISVGLVLAAWAGSNVFGTLTHVLNTAYDVRETRSWIRQQIIRLGTFVVAVVILIASALVFINGESIAAWIGNAVHASQAAVLAWQIAQFPIAFVALVALAFMTFYLLPNVVQSKSRILFAACLTTVAWIVATLLFRVYVSHFPPNPAYGLIGAIIILLTWMYYTMYVILAVGELASELHRGTGAIAPDRGTVFLGRIVSADESRTIAR